MSGQRMAAEMAEQPEVLARLLQRRAEVTELVRRLTPQPLAGVVFIGRGSSDNAALYGRYLAELAAGRPAGLAAPSLHTGAAARVDYRGYLAVALSQSGSTAEIVTTCRRVREAGAATVAITNTPGSPLAQVAEATISLDAGEETAVPATKTVTAEFLALALLAVSLGPLDCSTGDFGALPDAVTRALADLQPAEALARRWQHADRALLLSRGHMLASCVEAALKLRECAGLFAEGLSAADLLHGPILAAGPEVMALLVDWPGSERDHVARDSAVQLRARGVPLAFCAEGAEADLPLPRTNPLLRAIPAVVRGQQLALALGRLRGIDLDSPAGQSKVTQTA